MGLEHRPVLVKAITTSVLSLTIAALICGGSQPMAAMAPEVYSGILDQAPYHVQVEITGRTLIPPPTPEQQLEGRSDAWHGSCTLSGTIVHVFRDETNTLEPGKPISFSVPCFYEGGPPLIGGTIFSNAEALKAATFVEVIVDGPRGGPYEVAAYGKGIALINAPSETPMIEPRR